MPAPVGQVGALRVEMSPNGVTPRSLGAAGAARSYADPRGEKDAVAVEGGRAALSSW